MDQQQLVARHFGVGKIPKFSDWSKDPSGTMAKRITEQHAGDVAFFEVERAIGGIPVREMTLQDHAALCLAGSPFMVGGDTYGEDIAIFLWRIARACTPGDSPEREAFLSLIHAADAVAIKGEINAFLRAMYGPEVEHPRNLPARHKVAQIVVAIGAATGWREADILTMPLPRVFAYLAEIERSAGK